jgi:hypothetical protein
MQHFRRTWPVAVLLVGSLSVALRSIAADVDTLRRASAPAAEAARYLSADALIAATSVLALIAVLTGRSWAPLSVLGWMVTLLVVLAWVLFIAVGSNGPPILLRLGVWIVCGLFSAIAVHLVRRAWASDGHNAAA